MKERHVWFGAAKSLSGILTEPDSRQAGRPAVLVLNAGLLHRVGPNRLHVVLARRLAAAGFPVLRLDFSGLGESEPRHDELAYEEAALAEGIEAMDFLQASGVADRFVPMGICAGAEAGQRLACKDERIVGAVLIDGYAYRSVGYHLRAWAHHLLSRRSWSRLLTSPLALRHLLSRGAGRAASVVPTEHNPGGLDYERPFPPREACRDELTRILARNVDLFLIFTGGGMAEFYNHSRQFAEVFPALAGDPHLRVEFMKSADHTFTLRGHQDALLASISAWMDATLLRGLSRAAEGSSSAAIDGAELADVLPRLRKPA
jgi:pimeloyl-ACP methyl ester carboxylesterase